MLFADKVILVEGIAEKLLLPMFMEKCGCAYDDEHISIVEIGGKHFEHFVELFNGNNVYKKVLCITDRDFSWIKEDGGVKLLSDFETFIAVLIVRNVCTAVSMHFPVLSIAPSVVTFTAELRGIIVANTPLSGDV